MENKDALFIRKMISLVESTEDKIKNELEETSQEVDEQVTKVVQTGLETLAKVLQSEKGLFSTLKNEIPALSKFKNAEEMIVGLKNGEIATADAYKIIKQSNKIPEIALKLKGLVGESPSFKEIIKKIYPKGGAMPANPENFKLASETLQKTYGMSAMEAEALIKKGSTEMGSVGGVSTKAVDKAVSKRLKASAPEAKNVLKDTKPTVEELSKLKDVAKAEPKALSAIEEAGRKIGKYSAETFEKIKKLRGRLSLKQALLYGLATWGAYELIKGLFTSDEKTNGVLPSCIANLDNINFVVGTGDVVVATLPDGVDAKSTGHGGLQFWPNGRAITKDGTVRGNYYCAGTSGGKETVKTTVSEEGTPGDAGPAPVTGDFSKYSNIHIDWDGETKTVKTDDTNPNPNPSPKPKKSIYHDCESKAFPLEFGCKSTKIKEMQKCLGLDSKYQTGNFGPTTKAKLGVDTIDKALYDKTIANCKKSTGSTTVTVPQKTKMTVIPSIPVDYPETTPTTTTPTVSDDDKLKIVNRLKFQGTLNRYVYKGPDLIPDGPEYKYLVDYMQSKGYAKVKRDSKMGPNDRYVFKKVK